MRITVVGPAHPYKGGAAQHTTTMAHKLVQAGHAVTLESWSHQYPVFLYPGQQTVIEPEVPLFDPTFRRLSWRRPDGWFRHGRRIGRDSDVVVLMFHSPVQVPAYLTIVWGLRDSGARTVLIANNVTPHESRGVDRYLVRALLRNVDQVVVHHADVAQEARSLTSKPITIVELPPHLPESPAGTAALGPERSDVRNRLLFFGLVRRYKGVDILVRALAETEAEPRLLVAGEFWEGEQELRKLISDLQLDDRVDLRPGYVDSGELPSLFAEVDALVLPYRKATGSQNVLLAFRYGVPVIATNTGMLGDSVRDGVDGIVCAPGDVASLARAIDRLYEPGTPGRLREGVRYDDGKGLWDAYVTALLEPVAARA